MTQLVGEEAAVRPFRIDVPEEDLLDLRRRIFATEVRAPYRDGPAVAQETHERSVHT